MEITASSVLDIWDFFSEYVPAGKRNDAAIKFLKMFIDQDIEIAEFEEIRGEDVHLDHGLETLSGPVDVEDEYSDYEE